MPRPALKRRLIRLGLLLLLLLLAGLSFSLHVGRRLAAPAPRTIGAPPSGYPAETVHIPSPSGSDLVGWLSEVPDARGSIVLLHGVRADRRSMVGRARFLSGESYHTLCIDFQAHGESPGEHITMGHLEARDAAAAVAYIRQRHPALPLAVIGSSLGGAAALLADYQHPPDALVLEAVFADVETAVDNRLRMRFGNPGPLLTPLLTIQFKPLLGIDVKALSPLDAIKHIHRPVLLVNGSEDRHATAAEARALFQAANEPKELWIIEGAGHIDLHRHAGEKYETKVRHFLDENLVER